MTLDNIFLEKPIQIAGSKKWHVKFYAESTFPKAFMNWEYCYEKIHAPLKEWCNQCLTDEHSISYHWNDADPCWSVFIKSDQDLNTFLLRYGK